MFSFFRTSISAHIVVTYNENIWFTLFLIWNKLATSIIRISRLAIAWGFHLYLFEIRFLKWVEEGADRGWY